MVDDKKSKEEIEMEEELKKLLMEDLTEEEFKKRMLELAIKSGKGEKMLASMMITKEIEKYHNKVNAMFDVAQNGKLYPAVYVELMKSMCEMWLAEMKRKIVEADDKEELERYDDSIELIKDAMKNSGAFQMRPFSKKNDGSYIN